MSQTPAPDNLTAPIVLGRIQAVFAIHGWLKVESYTRPRGNIASYLAFSLRDGNSLRAFNVTSWKQHGTQYLVKFDGIDDRDHAQQLLGRDIVVTRADLPPPATHEYYWSDLIGMTVCDLKGGTLGTVVKLMETGANDVLVVRDGKEILIPFVRDLVIKGVDLTTRTIIVDWQDDVPAVDV